MELIAHLKDNSPFYLLTCRLINDKEAEADAKRFNTSGTDYVTDSKSIIHIKWTSFPHFYKKGAIIVQYVGVNKKIISDLKSILGKQFAGYAESYLELLSNH